MSDDEGRRPPFGECHPKSVPEDEHHADHATGDPLFVVTSDGTPVAIEPTRRQAVGFVTAHRVAGSEWAVHRMDRSPDERGAHHGACVHHWPADAVDAWGEGGE